MAFAAADRVKETSTTTGTGAYTLAGAATGFQSFAAIGDGNTCHYVAEDGTNWEVGIGTYTASGTTLARTTILASSNSDAAVNWSAGTRNVFCTLPADQVVLREDSGKIVIDEVTRLNFVAATELTISSGAITKTQFVHKIDTESDAGTDDLDTINGGSEGDILLLHAISGGSRNVVLKHATGNIQTPDATDITLDEYKDMAFLYFDDPNWLVISTNISGSGGSDTWTADQNSAGYGIDDTNGNELVTFTATTNAVNHLQIRNNSTGLKPGIVAAGDDSGIDIEIVPKGGGVISLNGNVDLEGAGVLNFVDHASAPCFRMAARSSSPTTPNTGDIYLDDGTNSSSSNIALMWYDGTSWLEIGFDVSSP